MAIHLITVVQEIDCDDVMCGKCDHAIGGVCAVFGELLRYSGTRRRKHQRCNRCLDAEIHIPAKRIALMDALKKGGAK